MHLKPLPPEHALKICQTFGIGEPRASTVVGEGVLNCNYILEADNGKYFIKSVREKAKKRIPEIFKVEAWMKAKGIPAVAMLTNASGGVTLEIDRRVYTVYPFIESDKKKEFSEQEFSRMGATLGRVHALSRPAVPADLHPKEFARPDKAEITKCLERYREIIFGRSADETDKLFLEYINLKLSVMPSVTDPLVPNDTLTHGDFHPGNLLFRDSEIVGVCDWEKTELAPRSYELARSLLYSCFESEWPLEQAYLYAKSFLQGYRSVCSVDETELRAGLQMKYYRSVLSTWLEEMYYTQGTDRANHFIAHEMELLRLFSGGRLVDKLVSLLR